MTAVQAILRAISLSSPLPKHESSAMGRQLLAEVRSLFPGFGIIATSAFLKTEGGNRVVDSLRTAL